MCHFLLETPLSQRTLNLSEVAVICLRRRVRRKRRVCVAKSPFLTSEADGPCVRPHDASPLVPTGVTPLNAEVQAWGGSAATQAGFVREDQSISDISLSLTFPARPEVGFAHLLHAVKATGCSGNGEAMAAALI